MMDWDAKQIRDLRRKMGWSPNDLARRLNCTSVDVLNWEMEQSSPAKEVKDQLEVLGLQQKDCSSELSEQGKIDSILKNQGLDQISHHEVRSIEN